jgi:hypothetical protein
MQKIYKEYRKNYSGQDVNTVGLYIDTKWKYEKEFISNPFINLTPLKEHAVVIGNGISRLGFDLKHFLSFKSGILDTQWNKAYSPRKFYTYGCNALYRDFKTDFLIATGDEIIKEIAESDYCNNNVVYANDWVLSEYTGKFHHIPQNPGFDSGAIAAYLAAFDGHKKVFLLGFDGNDSLETNYNVYINTNGYPKNNQIVPEEFWIRSLDSIMNTYSDTEFIRVMPKVSYRTPEPWKYRLNFRTIDFRQFVLEADV